MAIQPKLSEAKPQLLQELIPARNGHLHLENLRVNSGVRAWWQCTNNADHQWEAPIRNRAVAGYGCPYCSGRKTHRSESFAALHPEIAAELHPTLNPGLDPTLIAPFSNQRVWWQCSSEFKHEWQGSVSSRVRNKSGCKACLHIRNPLSVAAPEVAADWHPTKNGSLTAAEVSIGSKQTVWWLCSKNPTHEWEASVAGRVRAGAGCPHCLRAMPQRKYPPLSEFSPELARQFIPEKNPGLSPEKIFPNSSKKVWWQCPVVPEHQWPAIIRNRAIQNRGCPFCGSRWISQENCLAELFPAIAREWHPTKNGGLKPTDVTPGSSKRIWWQCGQDPEHEWDAVVHSRTKKRAPNRCPYCSGFKLTQDNCLAKCHPDIAAEWHPTKNGDLTASHVKRASGKRVWWQCRVDETHEWEAIVKNRTVLGTGCPGCSAESSSRRLQEYLLDSAFSNKNCYEVFSENLANLRLLAKAKVLGPARTTHLYRGMIFAATVTALETYLCDTFRGRIANEEKLRTKYLLSSPELKERKFSIEDILSWNGRIEAKIDEHLSDIVWHNLGKVSQMYRAALGVRFPTSLDDVYRAVARRHDIVHRNGRTKDGGIEVVRDSDLNRCFDSIAAFVKHLESQF